MRKLLWNSAMLLSGAILLLALALILSLLISRPQPGVAQQPSEISGKVMAIPAQATSPTIPNAEPTPVATPRPYPALDPEAVSILTANWLVLENREFGFRIKYPPTLMRHSILSHARRFSKPLLLMIMTLVAIRLAPAEKSAFTAANNQPVYSAGPTDAGYELPCNIADGSK